MTQPLRITVTGATGFLGRALCAHLVEHGYEVCGTVRSMAAGSSVKSVRIVAIGDINARTDWTDAVYRTDSVIHCAARAHIMSETAVDPLAAYREVNVAGTRRLIEQAAAQGVRRFIHVSSIGVLGTHTNGRGPFTRADEPRPVEDYAVSKLEAEYVVRDLARLYGLEIVIVRPPLVYGAGVKGNMLKLLQLIDRGWPLPFGAINNRRSFIGLTNLVDLLTHCVSTAAAAGQTLLATDGEDLSTPQLIRLIGNEIGRPAYLLPIPPTILHGTSALLGKGVQIQRVTASLQVDGSHTRAVLGWHPKESVTDGVRKMARAHRAREFR